MSKAQSPILPIDTHVNSQVGIAERSSLGDFPAQPQKTSVELGTFDQVT